ncbi:alcohol dehydrogenase catalytic domain-containing protein [Tissierella carlieri]|uniref:Alcohol dehydrogenase catalytic domain-containing protein n=1 Tax=Tissierella carlieri TaxID=689904 RepID=A0ABT1S8Q4_9FIRM|nr:zinc-binding dehydrogenase [Tissierella carlieri]MCQ4922856.1 alcohol dehydrogenase catalytic domain-containing protein [Tissierella carlieri]
MKGFAMLGLNNVGWIEKERPVAGPYDAILRPLALAPCTSDIQTVYKGTLGDRHNLILGHEAIGEIVEVGRKVKDFKPGDKVIVPAVTLDWRNIDMHSSSQQLVGRKYSNIKDGVFSEYFHVDNVDMNVALLPEGISLESAVMLTDTVSTGFHAVELAEVEYGDTVAVLGTASISLMGVAGAHLKGAERIIVVGYSPDLVKAAKFYGATDIINHNDGPIVEQILKITKGIGVDKVLVAGTDSDAITDAVKIVKLGGRIGNVNHFGSGETFSIPKIEWGANTSHDNTINKEIPGGRARMEKQIELVKYGKLDPSKIVTHVFHGFEKIEDALVMIKTRPFDLIKPVVIM